MKNGCLSDQNVQFATKNGCHHCLTTCYTCNTAGENSPTICVNCFDKGNLTDALCKYHTWNVCEKHKDEKCGICPANKNYDRYNF